MCVLSTHTAEVLFLFNKYFGSRCPYGHLSPLWCLFVRCDTPNAARIRR
ncbi:hypothetical protein DM2_2923 [Halorubrum sp. DM2]|nr:hypothetical protein DM2_2923 [Halorubrum sp. DM2]